MNRERYRKAFDDIPFDANFQQRAQAALLAEARRTERNVTHMKKFGRTGLIAAAVVAALTLSVSAAYLLLNPSEAARELDNPALAEAFSGEDAVLLNETAVVGDYNVTLLGMVSGKNLSEYGSDFDQAHTYVMTALARTDGTPLEQETYDAFSTTITPLVAGYPVQAVNCWTLDALARCGVVDGVAYYLLDTRSIEMFADHTVYLAVYQDGLAPSTDQFDVAADGSLSYAAGHGGALFTLPLDPGKADPAAAEAFVEEYSWLFPHAEAGEQTNTDETVSDETILLSPSTSGQG